MHKRYLICLVAFFSVACTSKINFVPKVDSGLISLEDKRTPEQKAARRDSSMSAIAVLGDQNVEPPALLIYQSSLQKSQKQPDKLNIVVDDFAIIDFFPARLSAATSSQGWLTNLVVQKLIQSKTDWSYVSKAGVPTNADSVICLFSGQINGKPIKSAKYSTYHTSPFAGAIRSTKEFQDAVISSIDQVAQDSISQMASETHP